MYGRLAHKFVLEFFCVAILSAAFCYIRQYGIMVHIVFGSIVTICTFSIYRYTKAVLNSTIIVSNIFTRWYGKKWVSQHPLKFKTAVSHVIIKTIVYALANFFGVVVGNFIALGYNNGLIYPPVMVPAPIFMSFVSQVAVCTLIALVYNFATEKGKLIKKPVMLDLEPCDGLYAGKRGRKKGPNHYFGIVIGATYTICGMLSHYRFGGVTDPMYAFVQNIFWGVYYWIPESIGMGFLYLLTSFLGGLIAGLLFLGFKIWWDCGCKKRIAKSGCGKVKQKKRCKIPINKNTGVHPYPYNHKPIRF